MTPLLHLTATEKKHIHHLVKIAKVQQVGKIGRKIYQIDLIDGDNYHVRITENKTDWCETRAKIQTHSGMIRVTEKGVSLI